MVWMIGRWWGGTIDKRLASIISSQHLNAYRHKVTRVHVHVALEGVELGLEAIRAANRHVEGRRFVGERV
jgi:hypothetical protein